ncbi:MAG: VIT domain-containing protein [Planctomycetota bacterium]
MQTITRFRSACLIITLIALTSPARAQMAANIIIPQSRAFAVHRQPVVKINQITVGVVILEQVATTTMNISLQNPSSSRLEAELIVPVPDGAVVRGFTFQGAAQEPTAQLLPKDQAHKIYDSIVTKIKDPALLEFIGYNLIRSSVFPVQANGTQKVRLTYEHLLPAEGNRIDYLLPRSESLEYTVPWKINVKIKNKTHISTVYSPTHKLDIKRTSPNSISLKVVSCSATAPGPFRLSYLLEKNGVTASLLTYPDPGSDGGYFLLLAGLPAKPLHLDDMPTIKREIILVIDRSGSMRGQKIKQAKEAALQILDGIDEGEAFNIISYNDQINKLADIPLLTNQTTVKQATDYINSLKATGGTNLHDALLETLSMPPAENMLPLVLFLTDGLPTVGQTSEVAIRNLALKSNPHQRRVFTFGVGYNVNAPLLEKIASQTKATATFVLPDQDVEVKVAHVFKGLQGPVLTDAKLETKPRKNLVRTHDVLPAQIPDLYRDDQLIVLGKYTGTQPLVFKLSGKYLGQTRTFRFSFELNNASTKNAFVPRLWASRKIAILVDAIRQLGADNTSAPNSTDPKVKELVDEIVKLSTDFGILTEYTAFLAKEGTDLSNRDLVLTEANNNFIARAMNTRSGIAGVNQSINNDSQMRQQTLNMSNSFYDPNMNRVSITNVQQINDLAFYQRKGRWVDSRIVNREKNIKPAKTIQFGSDEFRQLAQRLAGQDRQGSISLRGDILMVVDNETILIKGPASTAF